MNIALGAKRIPCTSGTGESISAHRRHLANTVFPLGKYCEKESPSRMHGTLPSKPSMQQAFMDSAAGFGSWRHCSSSGGSGAIGTPLQGNEASVMSSFQRMASSLLLSMRHTCGERCLAAEKKQEGSQGGICTQLEVPRPPDSKPGNASSACQAPFPSGHPDSGSALSQL